MISGINAGLASNEWICVLPIRFAQYADRKPRPAPTSMTMSWSAIFCETMSISLLSYSPKKIWRAIPAEMPG
ncbi:MAG TPA: hypothetical protein PJ981_06895 [Accumulibacter sp.]|nr:hypothetical protein [Accumulibacter sp.]HMX22413.1 hypothetical protein [Accumulibacter sp.]HNC17620.1 hypothetical protein [Accumulibacter sp.]